MSRNNLTSNPVTFKPVQESAKNQRTDAGHALIHNEVQGSTDNDAQLLKREKYILKIKDLLLDVNLGLGTEERATAQKVTVDIEIKFNSTLLAMQSDAISDTVCYDQIIKAIQGAMANTEFRLIEHLCFYIYSKVRPMVNDSHIKVIVTKRPNLIPNFSGTTSFEIEG